MTERIIQLEKMLSENPTDNFLLYAIALEKIKQGDLTSAKLFFYQLIEINPKYIATYYQLAACEIKLGNKNEAESLYKKGMAICKDSDPHTFSELQNALQNLQMGLEDY